MDFTDEDQLESRLEEFCQKIARREGLEKSYLAAIDPSVSNDVARQQAQSLVTRNNFVCNRIKEIREDIGVYKSITKEHLAVSLKRMSNVSIVDYFDVDESGNWKIKPPKMWDRDMRAACTYIKPTRYGMEIKIADKLGVISTISSMMGFNENNTNITISNKYGDMSVEELRKIAEDVTFTDFLEEKV